MAVLYTQLLNINNKKILTGSFSTQGVFLQEDYDILTEMKHLIAKALHPDNLSVLQSNKTYSKESESGRFTFYIGTIDAFEHNLCVAVITDTKSTSKTLTAYIGKLNESVQSKLIQIQSINVSCYQNDEKIQAISDEHNKNVRMINTNEVLESTHSSLVENLDNLIYRGQNINNLKSMAENLRFESEFMSKKVREMKNKEKYEKYKTYGIIAFIMLILIYFFFIR
ncbi:SEC22 [Enterospora canceri]|uniref:SEC22 n=1 Tax=Enterospora canceri TaxID=1081671 RepID=A0A1Y1S6K3_9MICR|nr:SEC22 [Enterospora canceri]